MQFKQSWADPCLYYAWTVFGLVLWLSWIDDCLVVGPKEAVAIAKKQLTNRFDCDVLGPMQEYVRCKIDRNCEERLLKITQPVLLRSFKDEFNIPEEHLRTYIPAKASVVLPKCKPKEAVSTSEQSKFQ